MATIERTPTCTVRHCPAPRDPDWHVCWCGKLNIEHHDVVGGGMGGGGGHHKRPENVVALCHDHHEAITTHLCSDRIFNVLPGRPYVYYDVRGNILHERLLEVGSAAAEAGVKPCSSTEEHRPYKPEVVGASPIVLIWDYGGMADALVLGTSSVRSVGSSPSNPIN